MKGLTLFRVLPFCLGRIFWGPLLIAGTAIAVVTYITKDKKITDDEKADKN
ncbi:MAG: hypothetical protein HQK51_04130 [Oligoflexia bacterium]|nr:hypothetical protein [Oligoflexia bacterium]